MEIDALKERINNETVVGIETSVIRDDYEPAGDLMIQQLLDSGEYVSVRFDPSNGMNRNGAWRVFKAEYAPF